MYIIAKPHPNTKHGGHEIIDLFSAENETLPWCNVHIDFFWAGTDDKTIYDLLYKYGKTLRLKLEVIDE